MSLHTKRNPLTTGSPKAAKPRRRVALCAAGPPTNSRRARAVDLVESPSGNYPPAGSCPNGSRPPQSTRCLRVGGGPGPIGQTTPPSDKRIPQLVPKLPSVSPPRQPPRPSSGKGSTSWRGLYRPLALTPGHLLGPPRPCSGQWTCRGRHSETTSRCPTAAQRASACVAPVPAHSPARA